MVGDDEATQKRALLLDHDHGLQLLDADAAVDDQRVAIHQLGDGLPLEQRTPIAVSQLLGEVVPIEQTNRPITLNDGQGQQALVRDEQVIGGAARHGLANRRNPLGETGDGTVVAA